MANECKGAPLGVICAAEIAAGVVIKILEAS